MMANIVRDPSMTHERVKKLAKLNPSAAPNLLQAYDMQSQYQSRISKEQDIYSRNFGTQEQSGPTRPGETLIPIQKANYGQAIPELIGAGLTESAGKLAGIEKQAREGGGNKFEGPVLFDLKGNTYRSTGDGKIVPVPVEAGATIRPPEYPYPELYPVTGQPV